MGRTDDIQVSEKFQPVAINTEEDAVLSGFAELFQSIENDIDDLVAESRQASLAKSHLETAWLFIQQAISVKGLAD